jgi:hypothetical protein
MTAAFDMTIPERFAQALSPLHPDGAQHAAAAALRLYLELGKLGVDALQSRAAHEGMTPAEVILNLLTHVKGAAPATTMTPRPKAWNKHDNDVRDQRIAQEYFDGGITYARLAVKYDLSTIRVAQIIAKARAAQQLV